MGGKDRDAQRKSRRGGHRGKERCVRKGTWLPGRTPSGCLHGARAPSSVYLGMWNRLQGRVQIQSTPRRRINRSFRPLCTSRDCVPCAVISPQTDQLGGLNLKLLPPCFFVGKRQKMKQGKKSHPPPGCSDLWQVAAILPVASELSGEMFRAALLQRLSQRDTTASAAAVSGLWILCTRFPRLTRKQPDYD